jgi:hypothetical protein
MKTHPLNVTYLVVGLVFLGIAGLWGLRESGVVERDQMGWLFPAVLVGAGVVGLVAMATRTRGDRPEPVSQPDQIHVPYDHDYDALYDTAPAPSDDSRYGSSRDAEPDHHDTPKTDGDPR